MKKKIEEKEEKISKRSLKLVEEMYIERDFTNGRFYQEEMENLIREEKLLIGYPI